MLNVKNLKFLFKKIGFDRGDERTILIGLYASRVTWIFMTIVLLIWTFQGSISTGQLGVQAVIFFISQAVFWSTYLYYAKRLGQ